MGKYFGTDGFRGEANVQLTVDNAFKVGRYVGWYYGRDHKAKIVIGKDTRRSSYMFEYALVAGLTASGADVYLPVSYTHLAPGGLYKTGRPDQAMGYRPCGNLCKGIPYRAFCGDQCR